MRSKIVAVVVALSALIALPALADEAKRPSFPMQAAPFKQMVEARRVKAREHMEKRASQLPADKAKEVRDQFAAGVAKVDAEVAKAVADGTVTKEEAKAVRAANPHHGRRGHHGGGHGAKGKAKT